MAAVDYIDYQIGIYHLNCCSLQNPTSSSSRGTVGCTKCKIMRKLWKHMEKEKGHKQAEE